MRARPSNAKRGVGNTMHELVELQPYMYMATKMGLGQMWVVCGSVVLPHVYYEADMQRAANELFRINESLRARFVEHEDGKVYQETKPFQEQKFDVMHFDSIEELHAWADIYATIPLELEVRSEGKGIPKKAWTTGAQASPAMVYHAVTHNIATSIKKVRYGMQPKPGCCEIKLVQIPGATGAIIKMHHVVSDAWSMALLANQFARLLDGEQPPAYQYEEHIKNNEKYRKSKSYERDVAYYREQISQLPEGSRPIWDKTPTSMLARRYTRVLDADLTAKIKEYATANEISPYILFLSAAGIFVRNELKTDKFFVVSVCGNRWGAHERNTVGLFATNPILPMDLKGDDTFAASIQAVTKANIACYRHQRAAGTILEEFDTPTKTSMTLSYQDATLDIDPSAICVQHFCRYWSYYYLTIEDRAVDGYFKMHLDSNIQIVSTEEAERMFDYVTRVLANAIVDDSKTIDELSK